MSHNKSKSANKNRRSRTSKAKNNRSKTVDKEEQELFDENSLSPPELGRIIAHLGHQVLVEDQQQQVRQCHLRQSLPSLVVGDNVEFQRQAEQGVVVKLNERHSLFGRINDRGQTKPIAANVSLVLLVIAQQPAATPELIDRYLIITEHLQIETAICFNKVDLCNKQELQAQTELLNVYEKLDYPIFYVSSETQQGCDQLSNHLKEHTCVFIGQSGVGKSSLIKQFLPHETIEIGAISEGSGKGRHTTTTARLYHFKAGGELIDAPGIRDLPLSHLSQKQLGLGFREFRQHLAGCKFNDCTHTHEPGCEIKNQVDLGNIDRRRWQSYQNILKEN